MSQPNRVHCVVAYARSDRQFLWEVELDEGATIADALATARARAGDESVPWDSGEVGIFGERKPRSTRVEEADRVEIYRPLAGDPRERRRRGTRHLLGSG